jgi:hypothetical protein
LLEAERLENLWRNAEVSCLPCLARRHINNLCKTLFHLILWIFDNLFASLTYKQAVLWVFTRPRGSALLGFLLGILDTIFPAADPMTSNL